MSTILRTFFSPRACGVRYVFIGMERDNSGDEISPINTFIGHLTFLALFLPSFRDGEQLMSFWAASIVKSYCTA